MRVQRRAPSLIHAPLPKSAGYRSSIGYDAAQFFNNRDVHRGALREVRRGHFPGSVDRTLLAEHLIKRHRRGLRADIYVFPDAPLSDFEFRKFNEAIGSDLDGLTAKATVPFFGSKQGFYGRIFQVQPGVFIPRGETQNLINVAVDISRRGYFKDHTPLLAADLCTGPATIACTLALEMPAFTEIDAVDRSSEALACARANVKAFNLRSRVNLLDRDLMGSDPLLAGRRYHLIACNPPYKTSADAATHVARSGEPALAVDGGQEGLDVIARVLTLAQQCLHPQGVLLMECGISQAAAVESLCKAQPFWSRFEVLRGQPGRSTVLIASPDVNFPLQALNKGPFEVKVVPPVSRSSDEWDTRIYHALLYNLDRIEAILKSLPIEKVDQRDLKGLLCMIDLARMSARNADAEQTPIEEATKDVLDAHFRALPFLEAHAHSSMYFNLEHLRQLDHTPASLPQIASLMILMDALAAQTARVNILRQKLPHRREYLLSSSLNDLTTVLRQAHVFANQARELLTGRVSQEGRWVNGAVQQNWTDAKRGLVHYFMVVREWAEMLEALVAKKKER